MAKVNYTREEKEMLVQILKKYPIIEEKKTDATSIKRKAEAWAKVCNDYNASSNGENRNQLQLKRCWDKIKRQRKGDLAEERRERMATGGGNSQKDVDVIPDVDVVAPHLTMEVNTTLDSDGVYLLNNEKFDNNTAKSSKEPVVDIEQNTIHEKQVPVFKRANVSPSKFDQLMEFRLENARLERQHMEELHRIRTEKEKELLEQAKIAKEIALVELLLKKKELDKI